MAQSTGSAAKNPYAAVWEAAERHITYEIDQIHALGREVDAARHGLNWNGGSASRFHARAHDRHEELHQHNDTLRYLLSLVRIAATLKPATPAAGGTT